MKYTDALPAPAVNMSSTDRYRSASFPSVTGVSCLVLDRATRPFAIDAAYLEYRTSSGPGGLRAALFAFPADVAVPLPGEALPEGVAAVTDWVNVYSADGEFHTLDIQTNDEGDVPVLEDTDGGERLVLVFADPPLEDPEPGEGEPAAPGGGEGSSSSSGADLGVQSLFVQWVRREKINVPVTQE